MPDLMFVDFETRGVRNLKKTGAYSYSKDALTEAMCFGYAFDDGPVNLIPMEDLKKKHSFFPYIRNAGKVVAHNAAFELAIWNNVCVPQYGWPELDRRQVICTMAMAHAMALPASLANAAQAMGLSMEKDKTGNLVMLQLCKPRKTKDGSLRWWNEADKFHRLYEYCKQDIEVERLLYKKLFKLSQPEQEVWQLDRLINDRGVLIDKEAVKAALALVEGEQQRLDAQMREATENNVPGYAKVQVLTNWLKSQGVPVEKIGKGDVIELLALPDLPPRCRRALEIRQEAARSSTAKLKKMLEAMCPDGRVRGNFQYWGANTGRFSGRNLQLQNLPRPKLKPDEVSEVIQMLRKVDTNAISYTNESEDD